MPDLRSQLKREMETIRPAEYGIAHVERRRDRKRRNRRVGVTALAIALSILAAVPLARAFDEMRRHRPAVGPTGSIVFSRQLADSAFDYLFTIHVDGSGQSQLTPRSTDFFCFSPDGSQLVVSAFARESSPWIHPAVLGIDGSGYTVLRPPGSRLNLAPSGTACVSPDGERIAIQGFIDVTRHTSQNGLYTMSVDGLNLVRLTRTGPRLDQPVAYSPDGSRILFTRPVQPRANGPKNLFVVGVDGSGLVQLNPPGTSTLVGQLGISASWSPDGRMVTFPATEDGLSRRSALFVVGADGNHARRLTPWEDGLSGASWSPDGTWIAFSRPDPTLSDLFIIHPDGTALTPVTSWRDDGLASSGAVWSPDGTKLLFIRGVANVRSDTDLWIVNADGSGLTQLTHQPAEYYTYGWAPTSGGTP
jgi:Tol biopolymer transport system component